MSTTDSPPPVDAGELLVNDHRELESLFARLEGTAGGGTDRADLIRAIIHDLSVHSAVEEIVLYPAARHELDDGDAVADQALAEGRAIKEMLVRLERLDATSPETDEVLAELMATVRAHVAEEEGPDGMIERLRGEVGDYRMAEMGRSMAKGKRIAPTHPHPHAPDTPPGVAIAGPAAGLVDRVRDAIKGD